MGDGKRMDSGVKDMVEGPLSVPAKRGKKLEIWLLVAVSILGLLGFMATLSTGDEEGSTDLSGGRASISATE